MGSLIDAGDFRVVQIGGKEEEKENWVEKIRTLNGDVDSEDEKDDEKKGRTFWSSENAILLLLILFTLCLLVILVIVFGVIGVVWINRPEVPPTIVEGTWSSWSPWSQCNCQLRTFRTRQCLQFPRVANTNASFLHLDNSTTVIYRCNGTHVEENSACSLYQVEDQAKVRASCTHTVDRPARPGGGGGGGGSSSFLALTTPNFPSLYDPNVFCSWDIRSPCPDLLPKVRVTFEAFDTWDKGDVVTIEEPDLEDVDVAGAGAGAGAGASQFYGDSKPADYVSKTSRIRITFQSDKTVQRPGVKMLISFPNWSKET